MFNRIVWPVLIAAVLYFAYQASKGAIDRMADLEEEGPSVAEQILADREFFFEEFAQRQLVQLREAEDKDVVSADSVPEPRPKLAEIIARFGEPDDAEETTLPSVRMDVMVYHYGRLGLATPKGQEDAAVAWLVIQ